MKKLILGTDWWTDCDDIVALRILTRFVKSKKTELAGIIINACMEYSVPSVDGFLTMDGISGVPIGLDSDGTDFTGTPSGYQKYLSQYAKNYKSNSDAEEAVKLYRRLLSEAKEPVELAEIGFLQSLAALLESPGDEYSPLSGSDLVKEKVSKIWIMAGKWDEPYGQEHNFINNHRSRTGGHTVCKKCPVPITFLGFEIGADVITGTTLSKDDHLYHAMCEHGSPKGRFSWDPMLTLLAVTKDEEAAGYDTVSGTAFVDPKTGINSFKESDTGLHKYVIKKHENSYYENMINEIIQ